jgi:hypothetical protein
MKQESKLKKRLEQERAFLFEQEENCKPLSSEEQETKYDITALAVTNSLEAGSERMTVNFKKLNNTNLIRPIAIRPLGSSEVANSSNSSERLINKFNTVLSFDEQPPAASILQVERLAAVTSETLDDPQSPLSATNRQQPSFIKRRQTIPRANSKFADRGTFSTIKELRLFTNSAHYQTPSHPSSYSSSYYTSPPNSSNTSPYSAGSHKKEHFSYLTRPYLNLIKMKMQKMKGFQENHQGASERRLSHFDYKGEKSSTFVTNDASTASVSKKFVSVIYIV